MHVSQVALGILALKRENDRFKLLEMRSTTHRAQVSQNAPQGFPSKQKLPVKGLQREPEVTGVFGGSI